MPCQVCVCPYDLNSHAVTWLYVMLLHLSSIFRAQECARVVSHSWSCFLHPFFNSWNKAVIHHIWTSALIVIYGMSVMCCWSSSIVFPWLFVSRICRPHTASTFRCSAVCTQFFSCPSEFLCSVDGEGLQTGHWWNSLLYYSSWSKRLIPSIQAVFSKLLLRISER